MSRKCRNKRSQGGFTIIEATISITLLLVVLVISMGFLISMRTFSQRQEMFTQPRQTARRAMDYISYYVRGAADMNEAAQAPNAIVCYYLLGGNTRQATYNNITDAKIGDVGTDLFTVAVPTWDAPGVFNWYVAAASSNSSVAGFKGGCGTDDAANLSLFKNLTGAHTESGVQVSRLLTAVDSGGNWTYYKITAYGASQCAGTASPCTGTSNCPGVVVTSNPASTAIITPPGGAPTLINPNLNLVGYTTFRVKNGQLQQKDDPIDSDQAVNSTATEDALFNTLLDNVEDMQVAWVYNDGNIYNANSTTWSSSNPGGRMPTTDPSGATTTNVPDQAGPTGTPGIYDATNVLGLRISIVARSSQIASSERVTKNRYFRPASEDRAAGSPDRFYRYRMTSTVLLRNRALGY